MPSLTRTGLPASILESLVRDYATLPSFTTPTAYYKGQWDTVQTVKYERTDEFYDLHVPGAEHYFAHGMWHHNTGKTLTLLNKLHNLASTHPRFRGLICRKVGASLPSTVLRTFEDKVIYGWDKASRKSTIEGVAFFGGNEHEPPAYVYDSGATITVGGLDISSKVLSSEYDIIYVNEATELTLEDWETLTTRARNMAIPNNRVIADCNPSYDRHWLLQRCNSGRTRRIQSRLKDNPFYFDEEGNVTEAGESYVRSLENLTGTRRQRLLEGEWVGMENAIYADLLDADKHFVEIPEHTQWAGHGFTGVDYGETPSHPSTVVTITQSTSGVWWVRAVWAGLGGSTEEINQQVRAHKVRFGISQQVYTDPTIRAYANNMGWTATDGSAGSRKLRVGKVINLLSQMPSSSTGTARAFRNSGMRCTCTAGKPSNRPSRSSKFPSGRTMTELLG